jgi:hypothetical protein
MYKGTCQAAIGDEGHIQIDGSTTDLIAVGQLVGGKVLGDIHHHVDLVLMQ